MVISFRGYKVLLHVVIKVYIVTFVGLNLIFGRKITLGSCFFKISRSLPCLAPKQVKRLSLGIDFNSKSFSNVILKHPLTFSASILNFWCRIMLVIEVLVIDVPCKLSSRSLLHLWTKGPFKYYVSKEVGGWDQNMAIFADLQYYLCWCRWVGGPKKAKNMLT